MECVICFNQAKWTYSPDIDVRGLGACEFHKEEVRNLYIVLVFSGRTGKDLDLYNDLLKSGQRRMINKREQVIKYRDEENKTFEEIGQLLQISKAYAHQLYHGLDKYVNRVSKEYKEKKRHQYHLKLQQQGKKPKTKIHCPYCAGEKTYGGE